MALEKNLLGKVFISHSASDKPFVRRIADRLKKEDYHVWLDEHELIAGDQLAQQISQALANSRVVLVIVSSASVKSKWLKFELNKATERMVQGQCRVIPVVKEKVQMPPEVQGLLYADFSTSFKYGMKSILTALEHEAHRSAFSRGFWAQAEVMLEKVFGPTGYVSIMGEYHSKDYNVVHIPVPSEHEEETPIPYEVVSAYGKPVKPLNDHWWDEYRSAMEEVPERFFLVITERPIGFPVDYREANTDRIAVKNFGYKDHVYGRVVILDLSGTEEESQRMKLLTRAKTLLIRLAKLSEAEKMP